ncbi:MAG TPA: hypothetical protein ENK13_05485, partial [Thermopetrobacter sp.]|nr:hypothetical protein [Thermopetrobacter sp.]
MSAAKTWSIKGVDESLREAAKRVAHSRGQTLGELINDMIRREAAGGADAASAAARGGADGEREFIMRRLDELGDQLRALVQREQETAVGRFMDDAPDAAALQGVIERIERNEQQAARALEEINARLDELSRRLQEGLQAADGRGTAGYQELETALRNVMQHMELAERRTSSTFEEFRARLDEVAAQAREALRIAGERAAAADAAPSGEELGALRDRVEGLAGRLGDLGREAEARARAYVDENLAAIGERVEVVQRLSQELPGRVEGLVTEVTGRRLGEVERRIDEMVGRLREKLESLASGVLDVDRIGGKVESLGRKLDELGRTAARRGEVEAIRNALEKLSAVVDDKADRADVEALAARLDEMSARLERERAELAADPAFRELDERVREMERALARAGERMVGRDAFAHLEKTLGTVEDRLQRAEAQLAYLPQLENSVARLFQSL